MQSNPFLIQLKSQSSEAIRWTAHNLMAQADGKDTAISEGIARVCLTLSLIADDIVREKRIDDVARIFKTKNALIRKTVAKHIAAQAHATELLEAPELPARRTGTPLQQLKRLSVGAIVWKAQYMYNAAQENPREISKAVKEVYQTLSLVRDEYIRSEQLQPVADIFGIRKADVHKAVNEKIKARIIQDNMEDDDDYHWPKFFTAEDKKQVNLNGFASVYREGNRRATGMWLANGKTFKSVANFVMEPLYLVKCPDPKDNKELFVVKNYRHELTIEFARDTLVTLDAFRKTVRSTSNFVFKGNVDNLLQIMEVIDEDVPVCEEVKILGWQPEGFFAYTDRFYSEGNLMALNKYGIGEHRDRLYFSPSKSILNSEVRDDDDLYSMLAPLNYKDSPITFTDWAQLMAKAYPTHGRYGIIFVFICLFRDIIIASQRNCPHLYGYGAPGSGKSMMFESLSALFYSTERSFPLSLGTDFAINRFAQVFRNCFHHFNELDDETVKPQWMQMFKNWYDNESRQRGSGKKNLTEQMKCNSAIGFTGQRMVNSDNNALPTRCIVMEFKRLEKEGIMPDQLKAFDKLKAMEGKGGFNGVLPEIMEHRDVFKAGFTKTMNTVFLEVRETIKRKNLKWHERIARNYSYMLTMAKLAEPLFPDLPYKYDQLFNDVIEDIDKLTTTITSTDASSDFWRIVSHMAGQNILVRGLHYKIETMAEVNMGEGKTIILNKPTRILRIRLNEAHTFYMQESRREAKTGINRQSLETYLKGSDYWIGPKNKEWWMGRMNNEMQKVNTSGYVFNYEIMEEQGYFMDYDQERIHNHPIEQPAPQQDGLPF